MRFDGVYMDTTVYVNAESAGEGKYGYSTFEIDMTPYLKVGKNEVYVRVVYRYLNTYLLFQKLRLACFIPGKKTCL